MLIARTIRRSRRIPSREEAAPALSKARPTSVITSSRLEVRLLGRPELRFDGTGLAHVTPPRVFSLLAFLIVNRDRRLTRAAAASSLWIDELGRRRALESAAAPQRAERRAAEDRYSLDRGDHNDASMEPGRAGVGRHRRFRASGRRPRLRRRGGRPVSRRFLAGAFRRLDGRRTRAFPECVLGYRIRSGGAGAKQPRFREGGRVCRSRSGAGRVARGRASFKDGRRV